VLIIFVRGIHVADQVVELGERLRCEGAEVG
jgi:hypothetical protein